MDLFRLELTEKAGQPVVFELEAIAVDIVSIRSAPDLEQMKQLPDRKLDPGTGKEVARTSNDAEVPSSGIISHETFFSYYAS